MIKQCVDLLQRRTSSDAECALGFIDEALVISPYAERLLEKKAGALLMVGTLMTLKYFSKQLRLLKEFLLHNVLDLFFHIRCFVILQLQKYEDVIKFCQQNLDTSLSDTDDSNTQSNSISIPWSWSLMIRALFYVGRLEEALDFVRKQEGFLSVTKKYNLC